MQTFPKPLKASEEQAYLLAYYREQDMEARRILIERNMRLVAHVIKKYSTVEKEMDDLLSIGTIGLIKAIDTFNPEKGSRLSTYAAKCIDNELLMMLRAEKKYVKDVSIYEPIGKDKEGNEIQLFDVIESEGEPVEEQIRIKLEIEHLMKIFSMALDEKDALLVAKRYGLFGCREYTQRELAEEMGISRSYVSRLEKSALSKLRAAMAKFH